MKFLLLRVEAWRWKWQAIDEKSIEFIFYRLDNTTSYCSVTYTFNLKINFCISSGLVELWFFYWQIIIGLVVLSYNEIFLNDVEVYNWIDLHSFYVIPSDSETENLIFFADLCINFDLRIIIARSFDWTINLSWLK